MYTSYTFAYAGGVRLHLHPMVCVASAVGRQVVGGECDVTVSQELAEDLQHHAAGLCNMEDEVHVAGGLLSFFSVQDLLCFDFANLSPTNFIIFSLKKKFSYLSALP